MGRTIVGVDVGGTVPDLIQLDSEGARLRIAKTATTTKNQSFGVLKAMAEAVVRVANAKMAGAIRMVSLSLCEDPRDFALFAFGGAGPLHAAGLARELSIPRVLIPARLGLTNALGCIVADLRHVVRGSSTPGTDSSGVTSTAKGLRRPSVLFS